MTEMQLTAIKMIADPDLVGIEWKEARETVHSVDEYDGDTEDFEIVCYSGWIYANLASLILAGDDDRLAEFIERVDSQRLVRDRSN